MIKIHLNIHQIGLFFFDSQNPLVVFIAPAYRHHPLSPPRRRLLEPAKRSPFLCAFWLVKLYNCTIQTLAYCVQPHFLFFTCYLYVIYRKIFNFTFNLHNTLPIFAAKKEISNASYEFVEFIFEAKIPKKKAGGLAKMTSFLIIAAVLLFFFQVAIACFNCFQWRWQ